MYVEKVLKILEEYTRIARPSWDLAKLATPQGFASLRYAPFWLFKGDILA